MKRWLIPAATLFVLSLPTLAEAGVLYGNPVADRMACHPGCLGSMVRCLGRCEAAKDRLLFGWMGCGYYGCGYSGCGCGPACGYGGSPYVSPGAVYYGSPYPTSGYSAPAYYYGGGSYGGSYYSGSYYGGGSNYRIYQPTTSYPAPYGP